MGPAYEFHGGNPESIFCAVAEYHCSSTFLDISRVDGTGGKGMAITKDKLQQHTKHGRNFRSKLHIVWKCVRKASSKTQRRLCNNWPKERNFLQIQPGCQALKTVKILFVKSADYFFNLSKQLKSYQHFMLLLILVSQPAVCLSFREWLCNYFLRALIVKVKSFK